MTDNRRKPYFSSALWPGIVLGLLSVIPILNYVNLICCLWLIAGGVLAAVIFRNEYGSITGGEGAFVGFLAGVIGSIVQAAGVATLWYFFNENMLASMAEVFSSGEIDPAMQESMVSLINNPVLLISTAFIFWFIMDIIFVTLGGLIGSRFIQGRDKKKTAAETFESEEPPESEEIEEIQSGESGESGGEVSGRGE